MSPTRSSSIDVSKLSVTSITYKWPLTINCPSCSNPDGIKSSIFPPDTEETTVQWQIKVKIINFNDVEVRLYVLPKNIASVKVSLAFDLQHKDGRLDGKSIAAKISGFKTFNFNTALAPGWKEIANWNQFCKTNTIVNGQAYSLTDKPILLNCTIYIVAAQQDTPDCVALFFKVPSCNLWQSFETLLTTGKNADVTLVAKDNPLEIKAHKAILRARSPVFDAMFSNELRENRDNLVEIKDLSHDVLERMIQFIYTGKASDFSDVADRLLMAADKYDLPVLRVMCEQQMGIDLTVENAAQTLVLADLHNGSQLKKYTLNFIKNHAKRVLATEEWMEIKDKHPNLLFDVCQSLATLQLES